VTTSFAALTVKQNGNQNTTRVATTHAIKQNNTKQESVSTAATSLNFIWVKNKAGERTRGHIAAPSVWMSGVPIIYVATPTHYSKTMLLNVLTAVSNSKRNRPKQHGMTSTFATVVVTVNILANTTQAKITHVGKAAIQTMVSHGMRHAVKRWIGTATAVKTVAHTVAI
jgi:hypothetical protein